MEENAGGGELDWEGGVIVPGDEEVCEADNVEVMILRREDRPPKLRFRFRL
jgi:hypothetical protein